MVTIKHISVQQAHQDQSSGAIYVDVRSIPEFRQGHPAGAYNLPFLHLDERSRQMRPNPDFVTVARANFGAEAVLVVGCQSGVRSQQACEFLIGAGFHNVTNVLGGFAGSSYGQAGWVNAGLPVETDAAPEREYDGLQEKTKGR
jgi:rhodanese-related sulfurtransferase